jgi:hypothetical protein
MILLRSIILALSQRLARLNACACDVGVGFPQSLQSCSSLGNKLRVATTTACNPTVSVPADGRAHCVS